MPDAQQSYKNHVRRDLLHMFSAIILVINLVTVTWTAVRLDRIHFTWISLLWVAVAFATVVIAAKVRTNPLKVQDRVIRLEERIRFAALLPPDLLVSAEGLTLRQIVALRFASDAELPGLVARTLAENLTPKQIKEAIQTWRPDHLRV